MGISLTRAALSEPDDRAALTAFLIANTFPFHVRTRPTAEQVAEAIRAGSWEGDDIETFWIDDERDGRVGVLRLDDLDDATAMVDLRLADAARGRGHGSAALRIATDLVFSRHPAVIRLEGQTREDNVAMRRVFERCGWVFEAYYRDGWPVEGGEPVASVAYSVLRRDWASGITTPVPRGPEVTLTGELRCADDDQADRVRAHLDEHLALTRAEPGCLSFDVTRPRPTASGGCRSASSTRLRSTPTSAVSRRARGDARPRGSSAPMSSAGGLWMPMPSSPRPGPPKRCCFTRPCARMRESSSGFSIPTSWRSVSPVADGRGTRSSPHFEKNRGPTLRPPSKSEPHECSDPPPSC